MENQKNAKTSEEVLKGHENKFKLDDWHGSEIQTDATRMFDEGTGKSYILRAFDFAIDPQKAKELKEKKIKLDKQTLFNMHWPQIKIMIWGDGLIANQDVEPRVVVSKNRLKYRIYVLCEPKLGSVIIEREQTLQEVFQKDSKSLPK